VIDRPPLEEVSIAAVATVAIVGWAMLDRRETRDVLLFWAGAMALVLVGLNDTSSTLLLGIAATVAAPSVDDQRVRQTLAAIGLAAVVLIFTRDIDSALIVGAFLAAAVLGPLLWYSYRNSGQPVMNTLIAGTALGIYINVPDTEQIVVLAAGLAVLALAMVFTPLRKMTVSFEALALIGALVVSAGAVGTRGRPAAFIGVVGALGVLLAEPLAGLVRRRTHAHAVVLITIHAVVVVVASRVAGTREAGEAVAIVAAVLAAAVILLAVVPRRRITARG
jgi:hypothetical protein